MRKSRSFLSSCERISLLLRPSPGKAALMGFTREHCTTKMPQASRTPKSARDDYKMEVTISQELLRHPAPPRCPVRTIGGGGSKREPWQQRSKVFRELDVPMPTPSMKPMTTIESVMVRMVRYSFRSTDLCQVTTRDSQSRRPPVRRPIQL